MTSSVDVLRSFVTLDSLYESEWSRFISRLNTNIGNYIGFDSRGKGTINDVVINIIDCGGLYSEDEGMWAEYLKFYSYHAPDFQDIPDEVARESIPITEDLIEELKYIREMNQL